MNDQNQRILEKFEGIQVIGTNINSTYLPYEKSVLKYEKNGKYGLVDFEGNRITKPIYEEIASVKDKEGEILAKKKGKYGVINNKGVELIPFEYDEIEADRYYDNGYEKAGYIVKKKKEKEFIYRCGYINSNWEKTIKTEYTAINRILDIDSGDVYLIAAKEGQYGLFRNGDKKIEFEYQALNYNKDTNLLSAEKNGRSGVINLEGKVIVPIEYSNIRFNGTYISAKQDSEEIYYNSKGEKVENGYTGMKKVPSQNCYITTNKENLYGIVDEKRK